MEFNEYTRRYMDPVNAVAVEQFMAPINAGQLTTEQIQVVRARLAAEMQQCHRMAFGDGWVGPLTFEATIERIDAYLAR